MNSGHPIQIQYVGGHFKNKENFCKLFFSSVLGKSLLLLPSFPTTHCFFYEASCQCSRKQKRRHNINPTAFIPHLKIISEGMLSATVIVVKNGILDEAVCISLRDNEREKVIKPSFLSLQLRINSRADWVI